MKVATPRCCMRFHINDASVLGYFCHQNTNTVFTGSHRLFILADVNLGTLGALVKSSVPLKAISH